MTTDHFWSFAEDGLALVSDIYCCGSRLLGRDRDGFGEDLAFADLTMQPDLSTFVVLPHVDGQARVVCDSVLLGRPARRGEPSPRAAPPGRRGRRARPDGPDADRVRVLPPRRQTEQPPFGGTPITTTLTNQRLPVLQQLARDLRALGLSPRTLNHEWGPTQYEAAPSTPSKGSPPATTTSRTRPTRKRSPCSTACS